MLGLAAERPPVQISEPTCFAVRGDFRLLTSASVAKNTLACGCFSGLDITGNHSFGATPVHESVAMISLPHSTTSTGGQVERRLAEPSIQSFGLQGICRLAIVEQAIHTRSLIGRRYLVPEDRAQIHVLLSSSMATDEHLQLRKRLCQALRKDPLLEVFAIETRASGYSSDEIMLGKIESWADVVLMILQQDLRPGVDRELNLAMRFGRRVVLLTHDGDKTPELSKLIEDLRREGKPFQRDYSSFSELASLAKASLRHDIVDTYRNSQRELFLLRKHVGGLIPETTESCHDFLRGHFLNANGEPSPAEEPECVATRLLMRTVVEGRDLEDETGLDSIIRGLPSQYREVVGLRWRAIEAAVSEDYAGAFRKLRAAQAEADKERLPLWVKRDIVLDLQYMEIHRYNQGDWSARKSLGTFQQQLASLSGWEYRSPVYYDLYSLGHRFLSETVKARLTGERTVVFGSNLPLHLDELSEALVSGIWLGSYNILRTVRNLLAELLLHYGFEYDDARLLGEGARLLAIEGQQRQLEDFLKLHSDLVADWAQSKLLSAKGFPALERESPKVWISRALLYEYLGDYVPDDEIDDVRQFFEKCYNFDVSQVFLGNVMRQTLRALPRFGKRFDAAWIDQLARPLLSSHPVVAGEAMAALHSARLTELDDKDLEDITDQILARIGHAMLPQTLGLLVAITDADAGCGSKIAAALAKEWREKKSVLAVQYFAATNENMDEELLIDMASEIISAIEEADKELTDISAMKFAGVSRWQLLAALVDRGAEMADEAVLGVVERVLTNPHQISAEKRDCLESLLWLASNGKLASRRLLGSVAALLSSRESEVLVARGFGSVLSASQEELGLYGAALSGLVSNERFDLLLRRVAAVINHERLDTRLSAVAALRHVLNRMDERQLDGSILLLRALISDKYFEVRHFASHGISEALRHRGSSSAVIKEIAQTLVHDPHPLVRAGVAHIAVSWGKEVWVTEILRTCEDDVNYQVRVAAKRKLDDLAGN